MNLSPRWVDWLGEHGLEAVHWSSVGDPKAPDQELMAWARSHGCWVFTHDLDFGAILASTRAQGPSVLQVRTQDALPSSAGPLVLAAITQFAEHLNAGALITVDERSARARILPLT